MVAMHRPEFDFEKNPDNLTHFLRSKGVEYLVKWLKQAHVHCAWIEKWHGTVWCGSGWRWRLCRARAAKVGPGMRRRCAPCSMGQGFATWPWQVSCACFQQNSWPPLILASTFTPPSCLLFQG